jgi:hypothetical protein
MAYIGREPQIGNYQICDAISVVNGQAAYTMQVSSVNVAPESVNHMIVSLNGVIQKPGSSYTISSSTITFSSNLATGDSIDFIYLLGNVLDLGTPSDDTVTGAKIVDNAINSEHYTDGSIDTAHIADLNVTTGKIAADAITGAKIADDAINSEHYTDGSIDTAHIADGQVTTAKLATAVFTGATDIGADIADADLFLMDDGAGGTIRKTAASRIKTYAATSGDVTAITSLFATDIKIGEDDETKIDFGTANEIKIHTNNNEAVKINNAGKIFTRQTAQFDDCVTIGGAQFTGDFQIEVSGLTAVSGNAHKAFGIRLSYRGIAGDATNGQNKDALIYLAGLTSWSGVGGIDTGGGSLAITVDSATTTAVTFTVTSPASTCVGAYVATLFANDESTMECNG